MPLKERVVEQLSDLIESGRLKPGDQLPSERDLVRQLGVSRTTVREAVQFLNALGVLEIRHGSGTFVAEVADLKQEWRRWTSRHLERVHELLEVRKGVEAFAAELAALRRTQADLDAMAEALRQLESAKVTALVTADERFHRALYDASGNQALVELTDAIATKLVRERAAVWSVPSRPERSRAEHRAIYRAIEAQEPDAARDAVVNHLASVETDIQRLVEKER